MSKCEILLEGAAICLGFKLLTFSIALSWVMLHILGDEYNLARNVLNVGSHLRTGSQSLGSEF